MSRQVFQIILNVPEDSGIDLKPNDWYAEKMEAALVDLLECKQLPGAAQVEVEYVGEA